MISLRLNGEDFDNFVSISVSNSLQSLSGKFSFVGTDANTSTFPFTVGDKVEVLVREILFQDSVPTLLPIANGFIDRISINYSSTSHTVQVTGRDKTEDIIDSQINDIALKGTFSLTDVIQRTLDFLGINKDIKILDDVVGGIDKFKGELAVAAQGETAFAFINKYAEKRQVLVSNDGAGNIILTRLDNPLRNGEILNLKENPELNNIKSAHVVYDQSQRFNEYLVLSGGNPVTLSADFAGDPINKIPKSDVKKMVNQKGVVRVDNDIRSTRKFVIVPNGTMTVDIATKRAIWEHALRIARSRKYKFTVQGFLSNDGLIWQTGQLVKVRDQFSAINADLLVSEIRYNFDLSQGSTTTLTLVDQDVYKNLLKINKLKNQVNVAGSADSKFDFSGQPIT